MTKDEVVERCNELVEKLEDLMANAEDLMKEIRDIIRLSNKLPTEATDIDDEEDK